MKKYFLLPALLITCITSINAQSLLDPTFGINGILKTNIGAPFNYNNDGKQVIVQTDGSMFFVVETNGNTIIAKKHADGSTDSTYGTNGSSDAVAITGCHAVSQADGKLVVAGVSENNNLNLNNPSNVVVARFNVDGRVDTTFNGTGINLLDFNYNEVINAVSIQTDQKIIVAGEYWDEDIATNFHILIVRYNSDGSIDPTFNGITNFGNNQVKIQSIAIETNGKIVVGGSALNGVAKPLIARYDSDGNLDSSFNGVGIEYIGSGNNNSTINSLAIQNDGKIIATGLLPTGSSTFDFAAARLNADGGLDSTFATDGIQKINFGTTAYQNSMTLQTDGKIILAGYTTNGNDSDFAIARLNINGSIDSTFNGDGRLTTDFGSHGDYANWITLQNDGKIMCIGYTTTALNKEIAAARYNSNGSLDNTFNNDGLLVDTINFGNTYYTYSAVQKDGKLIAAGYAWNGINYDFAIARYNIDGSLDNTFSDDGKQITDFNATNDKAVALSLQTDGKIVVAGSSGNSFGIARYNTNGTLDNTFGADGLDTTNAGPNDFITSIVIQLDGKILVAGSAIWRYNNNGTPDVTFGIAGKRVTTYNNGTAYKCGAVTLQNDDKIVIAGNDIPNNSSIITRYNTNGNPDSTFGADGASILHSSIEFDDFILSGKSIVIDSSGKIVVGGSALRFIRAENLSQFVVARANADGSPDGTFGTDGSGIKVTSLINEFYADFGTSLLIQNDNKILLGGYSFNGVNDNFTILRFNTDGSLDNTFGANGIEVTKASTSHNRIGSLALANNRLYAAGFGQYPDNFGVVVAYLLQSSGPLPVSLINFSATLKNQSVLLQWQTASEQNLSSFMIERSADNIYFVPIDNVAAKGNSNIKVSYSTLDQQPLSGINFYRLKMFDIDGKFTYSKIVSVNLNNPIFTLKIFPNPASNILFIEANGTTGKTFLQITDEQGRKLKEIKITVNENTIPVDIHNLPKGIYNLILRSNNKTGTKKFMKE